MANNMKQTAFSCRLFACRGRKAEPPFSEELQIYFKNDSSTALESVVLERIGFEWAEIGKYKEEGADFGPVLPGAHVLIWRDPDPSPEVRLDAWLQIRWATGQQRLLFEFGKLYMYRGGLMLIPELNREGCIAEPQVLTS